MENSNQQSLTQTQPAVLPSAPHKSKLSFIIIAFVLLIVIGGGGYLLGAEKIINRPPSISSISPNSGSIGTQITLKGNNFTDNNYIKLSYGSADGYIANVPSVNSSTINFTIPKETIFGCSIPPFSEKRSSVTCNLVGSNLIKSEVYKVSVENKNGKSNEVSLRITMQDQADESVNTDGTANWKTYRCDELTPSGCNTGSMIIRVGNLIGSRSW